MNKTKSMLTMLGAAVFIMSSAFMAQGSTFRSFVSDTGSDGNTGVDCQPAINACRTFQAAIGQTNAGGDVVALSSTGYSAFSINKPITIEGAPGVTAFIFVGAGGTGITVTGASTDLIVLRNIYVDGLNNGSNTGLSHTGAAKLVVEDCTFRSLTTGVSVAGTGGSPARMDLINSNLFSNGTAVLSTGLGANYPGNPPTLSNSMVRINGGNITNNTIALNMASPGSASLANIALFAPGGGSFIPINMVANGTTNTCSGTCNVNPINYQWNSVFGP